MSVVIPYVDEPHPVTGVTNAKLGIWLFLASEVMLFGALFSTLIVLRNSATDWPAHVHTPYVSLFGPRDWERSLEFRAQLVQGLEALSAVPSPGRRRVDFS